MNFFHFLKSLDDLLYEVVSWLAFYPVTLWRSLRRPIAMMHYAAKELERDDADRFGDALSPPIFLLLTVLVAHALELALVGESKLVTDTKGVAAVISDDTSLILLRLVAFSTFPLIFAVRSVRARGVLLTRRSLEPDFFSQCYVNAPFALLVSLAATAWQWPQEPVRTFAAVLTVLSTFAFLGIETVWLRGTLRVGTVRAAGHAVVSFAAAFAVMIALALLVAGRQ